MDEKGDLQFLEISKVQFTCTELDWVSNIMVAGETGVGKSTWIHAFLNYMQGIQIEENIRYLLFNEKEKQKKYDEKHGEKNKRVVVLRIYRKYIISKLQFYLIIQLD